MQPRLLSADVVSLSIFTSYDCGGAHPDFGDAPLTLDVRSGKPLGLEDLLWVGDGPAFHYRETREHKPDEDSVNFDVFSQYRNRYFAPWLVEQWRRIVPEMLPEPADDFECTYADPDMWDFPSWYLNEDGIVFDRSSRVLHVPVRAPSGRCCLMRWSRSIPVDCAWHCRTKAGIALRASSA